MYFSGVIEVVVQICFVRFLRFLPQRSVFYRRIILNSKMTTNEKPMPQDFLRLLILKRVKVTVLEDRELVGILHSYDEHCNIILGEVTESLMGLDSKGCRISVSDRNIELLFIRGDRIVSIAPL